MINKEPQRQRIGQRIAEIRKAQGITQQDLADRTGIQRNHISRIEQGRYTMKQNVFSVNGEMRTRNTTKVTGKGQVYFINKFLGDN